MTCDDLIICVSLKQEGHGQKMKFYPVHLNIKNRRCLVVGGGTVAARKARTLVKAGASVVVVSPDFSAPFNEAPLKKGIQRIKRAYHTSDMTDTTLIIAATNHPLINRQIAREATQEGILCNIVDAPDASDFILPAIVQRGDLLLTVSTSGSSPALARQLRKQLAEDFGDEYGRFLIFMGRVRKRLLDDAHDPDHHALIFRQMVTSDLLAQMAKNDAIGFEATLAKIFSPEQMPHLPPLYTDLFPHTASAQPMEAPPS